MKTESLKISSVPVNSNLCTGCSACASVCPAKAIKMSVDSEGFYVPVFNQELCTNCKLCTKVCPIISCHFNKAAPEALAVMVKDEKERLSCSSGGVVSTLSRHIIDNGGYVCGCITQNFEIYHEIISKDNFYLFERLKGSKYVQSDLRDVFVRLKQLLRNGKVVLFVGSGCQVAGLKNFLIKPYSNLITVDFICHGVPSPKFLKGYVDHLRQVHYAATNFSTRDKIEGWQSHHVFSLYDENGDTLFRENGKYNVYISSFLANLVNRHSCGNCKFTKVQRVSDITVGDFWKIRKFNKKFDDRKGTSLVLCNSDVGQKILDETRHLYSLFEPVPIDFAKTVQPQLSRPARENANRGTVFDLMNNQKDYLSFLNKKIFKVGILTFHFLNDFGSVLIAYAMQEVLKSIGYAPEIINYIGKEVQHKENYASFRKDFLNISPQVNSFDELCVLQKKFKKIIVGSNQVWRYFDQNVYMMKFATGLKTLIAYGASFGKESYTSMDTEDAKRLLKRFSSISVREPTGLKICKEQFNLPALRVIDPTLLLNAQAYQRIIDNSDVVNIEKEYIGYSFSKRNREYGQQILNILRDYHEGKLVVKNLQLNHDNQKENTVGGWLYYIQNSNCVITDSLHAVIFAILFKKIFWCLISSSTESSPLLSMLRLLKLTDRIIWTKSDFNSDFIESRIDYDSVYKILSKEREKALCYLNNSLSQEVSELT